MPDSAPGILAQGPSLTTMAISAAERRVLGRGPRDFASPEGRDLLRRCAGLEEWVDESAAHGLFQFPRYQRTRHGATAGARGGIAGRLDLGSPDYLGLATHPTVVGAGSDPMGSGPGEARRLERRLGSFLGFEHVALFPTDWLARFGTIKALIRPYDHVVIDAQADDGLREGAAASTTHVHSFAQNDMGSLERRLARVRAAAPSAAILAITESLSSTDSDYPDFALFSDICRQHGATTFIGVTHDFGCLGPAGAGLAAASGCLSDFDIVAGSFSMTLASVGGFCATHARGASYAVRGYSGSYTSSNYLPPAQLATILAALDVIQSPEGDVLRTAVHERAFQLRQALASEGLPVLGRVSPIVLTLIGSEAVARVAYRQCLDDGLIVNLIEYPACRRGQARFRMQVSPGHSRDELTLAASIVGAAIKRARVDVIDGPALEVERLRG